MTFSACQLLAAALTDAAQLPQTLNSNAQYSLRGLLPILISIGAVVLAVVGWAVFIRRSPKYRRRGALLEPSAESSTESPRHRRRRRRREHRGRNPTRSETGGLPPPGAGGSDPPPL